MEVFSTASDIPSSYLCAYSVFNQNVSVYNFGDVLVTKDHKTTGQVKIISGGKTSYIDYVGKGMLTATVQGPNSESPTPTVILKTIRELSLNHINGILVIISAHSEDSLSFGLAVERAINDDLHVMFLSVSENCGKKTLSREQQKSSNQSGMVLIYKIAGALSQCNKFLPYIFEYCTRAVQFLVSDSTTIPKDLFSKKLNYCQKSSSDTRGNNFLPTSTMTKENLQEVLTELLGNLINNNKFVLSPGDTCILLINNLGAFKRHEEYVIMGIVAAFFEAKNLQVVRLYIGQYFRINDNVELNISLLKNFDEDLVTYLDASCSVPGWFPVYQDAPILKESVIQSCLRRKCRLSPPIKGPKLRDRLSNVIQLCLQFACDALISCEKMLNKIDSEIGNGDTGSKMRSIAEVLNKRSCNHKLNLSYPFTFFLSLSKILDHTVGGDIGCVYSILFEAVANKFGDYREDDEISFNMWIEAMENACNALKKYGGANIDQYTVYNPISACLDTMKAHSNKECNSIDVFSLGVSKAEDVALQSIKPGCKYPNAEAHAVGIWLRATYEGVKLKC